ncbi:MAG: tripartite tricarboxylate transporter substrate binding protein [Halofilum sp. (in: g-proteobacteria)]|nr:tripartite tricarboxylate transporter substrate binding protein [Halofilum sp. (in: g-proteobacteria)]
MFNARIARSIGLTAALAMGVFATAGHAQDGFPERGLTLIVAYGAGGGTDTTARMLAKDLENDIGESVTVRNITGGGGWNGWSSIANATADGYTIGYINIPNMYAGYLNPDIGRPESLESFTPLMNHVTDYCIWAVAPDSPYESVEDVVQAAKENPGSVSITAHGYGNDDHLAILRMQAVTGAEFKVVHNDSTADSKSQVMGGHVDVLGGNVSEIAKQVEEGELRALGVMAPERSKFLPDTPTFQEQGFDQVWSVSRGIAAPGDLSPEMADKLTAMLQETIGSEAHREKAARLGLAIEVVKGREYQRFLKTTEQEIKKLMGW